MRHRNGFSLTELLVVAAVVAVLAAMLLPAAGMVRAAASSARCLASLRQVGMAGMAYADEWRGQHCPTLSWVDQAHWFAATYDANNTQKWQQFLAPYFEDDHAGQWSSPKLESADQRRTVFKGCPDAAERLAPFNYGGSNVQWEFGYGMNDRKTITSTKPADGHDDLWTWRAAPYGPAALDGWRFFNRAVVDLPSARIWAGDSQSYALWCERGGVRCYGGSRTYSHWQLIPWGDLRFGDHLAGADPLRHRSGANYLFFDGHVAALRPADAGLGLAAPDLAR